MKAEGSCLCKSVRFSFDITEKSFDACHCSMCRKWGGGPGLGVTAAGNIALEGEDNITIYDSSEWAQRAFCKKCGSNLFYRLKGHDFCNFPLGIIDNHEEYKFVTQIYVDSKPDNYSFAQKTKMMTEQEVLDAFGVNG